MRVSIGINPITWSNDDMPELGGATPLETCLAETKQAGYAGIEKGGKFPSKASELKPLLAAHGLRFVSGWFDAKLHSGDASREFDAMIPHLTLLKEMGCSHCVFADTSGGIHGNINAPLSTRPKLMADEWKAYGRKVTAFAERMADFGVRMAFHHHMGTIVEAESEIDALMNNTGEAAGLLYDTGHTLFGGGDPLTVVKRHVKRVVHVHCKDLRADVLKQVKAVDTSFLKAVLAGVFTVPGDGMIAYEPILKVLAEAGYSGWLIVEAEQDPAKAHPLTYATMGYTNLSRMAKDAGFTVV